MHLHLTEEEVGSFWKTFFNNCISIAVSSDQKFALYMQSLDLRHSFHGSMFGKYITALFNT